MHRNVSLLLFLPLVLTVSFLWVGSEALALLFITFAAIVSFAAICIGAYLLINLLIDIQAGKQKLGSLLKQSWLGLANAMFSIAFLWWLVRALAVMSNL